jgi:hypothetical protein
MALYRSVEVTVPAERTEELLRAIRELPDLLGLQVNRGASVVPPGDAIAIQVKNRGLAPLMRLLVERGVGRSDQMSLSTSYPASIVSPQAATDLGRETSDATWEEMEAELGKESNMTVNALMLMAGAGVLATVGLQTNALHIVIGAMAIAPGFGPILRMSLGLVAGGGAWRRGAGHTALGYSVLIIAAAATAAVLQAAGLHGIGSEANYLPEESLYPYWSTFTVPSVVASVAAGIAGAVLIATNRAVLTAGVMIALALIPAAALIGIALVSGAPDVAGRAAARWVVELGIVAAAGMLVFAWKKQRIHRRDMLV